MKQHSTVSFNKKEEEGGIGRPPSKFLRSPFFRGFRSLRFGSLFFLFIFIGAWPRPVLSAPFRPADDAYVLERLPSDWANADTRALQKMRDALRKNPMDLAQAVQLAKGYINLGRADSDPRYYGYAQAALSPWLNDSSPPTAVILLKAIFKQNAHDFDGALLDLSRLLKAEPDNAQALLTRALILQVQGRYKEAKQGCLPLIRLATDLVTSTCIASVASLNGEAMKSYTLLKTSLDRAIGVSLDEKVWVLTILAEIADRRGDSDQAEKHFQEALSQGVRDTYLLTAYADFLLDAHQPERVISLLKGDLRADGLLLRRALAKKQRSAPDLSDDIALLRSRFEAARMRADTRHLREEALFTLKLLNQPQNALTLALTNWGTQKEPLDLRILLESAIAANDFQRAEPALRWMRETRIEDLHLAALAKKLETR